MNTTNNFQISLSEKVLSVTPSVTLAISAKAKELKSQGLDVIALSGGEPDFDTPSYIKDAAIEALNQGVTKYTPAIGTLEFREAICEKLKRDQGLMFQPDQIVVSVGAKHSVFNILFALLNQGDEVLIPSPYWLSYPEMVTLLGGESVVIPCAQKESFKLTPEKLRAHLTEQSKVLILNSPSNPTGAVYTKEELCALADVLKDFPQVAILSDEIYEKLIFDGGKHYSIAEVSPEIAARTILVNGHSKAYSMTGWRLGYAAFPTKELAKAVASIQSHSTSNPTAFAQAGGIEALKKGDKDASEMRNVFEKRRNVFYEKIKAIEGLEPYFPEGAFYLFVDISATGMRSVEFCEKLLTEAHVAAVPGKSFGSDEHVRMSFSSSEEHLLKAAERIAEWVHKNKS